MKAHTLHGCLAGLVTAAALALGTPVKADIVSTLENAASGSTITLSGTYTVTVPIYVAKNITLNGPATFNFSGAANGLIFQNGSDKVNQVTVTNTAGVGFYIYESSGTVLNSCIAEGNGNTGMQIQGAGASNNTIQYCQSYNNVDTPTDGQNADGITVKFGAGSGNVIKNSNSFENADDGFDFWEAASPVAVSNCLAYSNGKLSQGNGNGFKMGAAGDDVAHTYTSCTAHNNSGVDGSMGFDTNGNVGKCVLTTCHSYSNGYHDTLGNCILNNCTMQTSN